MNDDFQQTTPCEGSDDLNGKDATFRGAAMISEPSLVVKRRIRGALVPIGRNRETPG